MSEGGTSSLCIHSLYTDKRRLLKLRIRNSQTINTKSAQWGREWKILAICENNISVHPQVILSEINDEPVYLILKMLFVRRLKQTRQNLQYCQLVNNTLERRSAPTSWPVEDFGRQRQ